MALSPGRPVVPAAPPLLACCGRRTWALHCLPERGARSFPPAQCLETASPAQHCPAAAHAAHTGRGHICPSLLCARPATAWPGLPCPPPRTLCPVPCSSPGRASRIPRGSARSFPTVRPASDWAPRPAKLPQAACLCSFSPGASKGAGARDVHVFLLICCKCAQGLMGNKSFYYWFGAFSSHFKLAFLSESQYAGYKF